MWYKGVEIVLLENLQLMESLMEPLRYMPSATHVLIAAVTRRREKNEPSFIDKTLIDGFICIIEPGRVFFPLTNDCSRRCFPDLL